jgi:hypothetical protein
VEEKEDRIKVIGKLKLRVNYLQKGQNNGKKFRKKLGSRKMEKYNFQRGEENMVTLRYIDP